MGKATKLTEVALDKLIPYENNAKIHSTSQVEKLKASIEAFGFISPCLIDKDYNIIAGHGRALAAREAGLVKVPCLFVEGLSEEERKAYILADNKLTELGDWDLDLVNKELESLKLADFDVSLTGFVFNDEDFENTDFEGTADPEKLVQEVEKLEDKYIAPPFSDIDPVMSYFANRERKWSLLVPPLSVFEVYRGYWQKQKKAWNAKGFDSYKGREGFSFDEIEEGETYES